MDLSVAHAVVAEGEDLAGDSCGFPLLRAFLSFYLGADERRLRRVPAQ